MNILILFILISANVIADENPKPHEVGIEQVKYTGTGCPEGTVANLLAADRRALTLLFSDFLVDGAGSSEEKPAQRHCNVRVKIRVNKGWSFGFYSVDYRGYASLAGNSKAALRMRSGLKNEDEPPDITTFKLKAPYADDYKYRYLIPKSEMRWSECAQGNVQHLVLGSQITVRGPGVLTVDSMDHAIEQKFGIAWKRCKKDR